MLLKGANIGRVAGVQRETHQSPVEDEPIATRAGNHRGSLGDGRTLIVGAKNLGVAVVGVGWFHLAVSDEALDRGSGDESAPTVEGEDFVVVLAHMLTSYRGGGEVKRHITFDARTR